MSDRRVKAPRLMSRAELAEHMEKFHGGSNVSREAHNRAHHVTRANHSHRPARLSEVDHADWRVSA